MLYADGLGAVFAFGGIYAASVFGWGATELGLFGIVLTIAGTVGAGAGGFLDDRAGSKTVIVARTLPVHRRLHRRPVHRRRRGAVRHSRRGEGRRQRPLRLGRRAGLSRLRHSHRLGGRSHPGVEPHAAGAAAARPTRPPSSSASIPSPARSPPSPRRSPSASSPRSPTASASASPRASSFSWPACCFCCACARADASQHKLSPRRVTARVLSKSHLSRSVRTAGHRSAASDCSVRAASRRPASGDDFTAPFRTASHQWHRR